MQDLGWMAGLFVLWVFAALFFFLTILSIAIDAARILRRLNRIIALLERRPPPPGP
jgi:ABC-type antimicrobial peptide transport system permease subunit